MASSPSPSPSSSGCKPSSITVRVVPSLGLRGSLILGLFLQSFLIIYAPSRKRKTSSNKLIRLIWSAYFLADWTGNFAISVLWAIVGDDTSYISSDDLLAIWLPILLIYLGGADTIISSTIQENKLSFRIVLFYFQVGIAFFVFARPSAQHQLLMPKLFLILVGIIRYAERWYAVNLASMNRLKKSMLKELYPEPSSLESLEDHSKREANVPVHTDMVKEGELESDIAVVLRAYRFFKRSRGLLVGLLFSFEERYETQKFFHQTTSEEAYKLIAVELNFIYESLFTKAFMVHSKMGYFVRTICYSSLVIAFISFHKDDKKDDINGSIKAFVSIDIVITYTLLCGAIALEMVSFFKLIFSDWTVVALETYMQYSCVAFVFGKYLKLKRSTLGSSRTTNSFQRWSKSVTTFSFVDYSIKVRSKRNRTCFALHKKNRNMLFLKGVQDEKKFGSSHPLTGELWNFIFKELKRKSILPGIQDGTTIYSARGNLILDDSRWRSDCSHLLSYVNDYDYDQSILLWHIATEICFNIDKSNINGSDRMSIAKTLSGYMLYLLILEPIAMSSVAGIYGEIGFGHTSAEAQLFFTGKDPEDDYSFFKRGSKGFTPEYVSKMILEAHNPEVKSDDVKGNKSKSLLSDACALSRELMKLGGKKWDLVSEVWVEMVSYAAGHCEASTHADFLTRGGQLVTFVWLLMAHLGIMKTTPVQTKEVDKPRANQADEC